jgi:hypothetical protein
VSRPQRLQPPQQRDLPGERLFQATTRPETGASTREGALPQRRGVVGRPVAAGVARCKPRAPRGRSSKGRADTDGMLGGDGVVEPLWHRALCVSGRTREVAHAVRGSQVMRQAIRSMRESTASRAVFTQSRAWFGWVRSRGPRVWDCPPRDAQPLRVLPAALPAPPHGSLAHA